MFTPVHRRSKRRWITVTAVLTATALALSIGGYVLYQQVKPYLLGTGCEVRTADGSVPLDIEQTEVAATIAGVAARERMPERAVVIAYAAALQESKLRNLVYGDRDSIGVFQQRPSQGWGPAKRLRDPVYASARFFAALAKVRGYLRMRVHVAAQRVQRSADGTAYARHVAEARLLAAAFTGRLPRAVHCWFPPHDRPLRMADAHARLRRTVGGLTGDGQHVFPEGERSGWLMASWAVAHARRYGIQSISYAGARWTARRGHDGWKDDRAVRDGRIALG